MELNLLSGAVAGLVHSGHRAICFIKAGLVQDWVRTERILILVEKEQEFGLLLCITNRPQVTCKEDVTVEYVIPVKEGFKLDLQSLNEKDSTSSSEAYFTVGYVSKKFLFEIPSNATTKQFVHEVTKALEKQLRSEQSSSFSWLNQYASATSEVLDFERLQLSESQSMGFEDDFVSTGKASSDLVTTPSQTRKQGDIGKSRSAFYVNNGLESPDGFSNLPRDSIAIGATPIAARESLIRFHMSQRDSEYIDLKSFTIFVGTWNVNGQYPSASLGEAWLACDPEPPDMYVIGFQELDLSKEAYLFTDSPREEEWYQACRHGLHPKTTNGYVKVKLVRLVGMMLVVFVRKELSEFVTNIAAETVGTGLLGKLGNKGGVAVRFEFHETSFCFVNCHLAAHVEYFERRNQDYNDILSHTVFRGSLCPPKYIKDHDHIYWLGDMNYRITGVGASQVKSMLEEEDFLKLLDHDQLRIQQRLKRIFVGFQEGDIKYQPTYKYDVGSDNWDSSEKNRPPAWCDRILWKGGPTKLVVYRSHMKLRISDHKPVSCLFEASVKVVNQAKYRKVYEDVMKKLDRLENEFLPQVTVDKMEINFGSLTFNEPLTEYLTIANTGQVPFQYEFSTKPNHDSYCKRWLTLTPYTANIMPGETLEVEVKICVDKDTASHLNAGDDILTDILVLHLDQGRDLFITVIGNYLPSCFGASIESLIRLKAPVRETDPKVFAELQKPIITLEGFEPCWDIPKEVWVIIDHLYKYGMIQNELFQQPGLHSEFKLIRDALDFGWSDKLTAGIHSVAESLLLLLEAFSEPLIPFSLYQQALDASHSFTECKKVVTQLPAPHRSLFYYIIAFMRELLRHSNHNRLEQKFLATIFGTVSIRCPDSLTSKSLMSRSTNGALVQQAIEKKKAAFFYHFLINDFDI
ncbi:Inositol polyphosphate 5-phosphatase OCRL [Halotydeus destructor]|nr:Inositol polyphosphate 5-phosphatase OCRL [Halotydeus destructor]